MLGRLFSSLGDHRLGCITIDPLQPEFDSQMAQKSRWFFSRDVPRHWCSWQHATLWNTFCSSGGLLATKRADNFFIAAAVVDRRQYHHPALKPGFSSHPTPPIASLHNLRSIKCTSIEKFMIVTFSLETTGMHVAHTPSSLLLNHQSRSTANQSPPPPPPEEG